MKNYVTYWIMLTIGAILIGLNLGVFAVDIRDHHLDFVSFLNLGAGLYLAYQLRKHIFRGPQPD